MGKEPITVVIYGIRHRVSCGICGGPVFLWTGQTPYDNNAGCHPCGNWACHSNVLKAAFDYIVSQGRLADRTDVKWHSRKGQLTTQRIAEEQMRKHPFVISGMDI